MIINLSNHTHFFVLTFVKGFESKIVCKKLKRGGFVIRKVRKYKVKISKDKSILFGVILDFSGYSRPPPHPKLINDDNSLFLKQYSLCYFSYTRYHDYKRKYNEFYYYCKNNHETIHEILGIIFICENISLKA